MGKLTTHVLDTMHGCPAAGMQLALWRLDADAPQRLKVVTLNADGRADAPLLEGDALQNAERMWGTARPAPNF